MTGAYPAILRHLNTGQSSDPVYTLSPDFTVGREPKLCQLVLDSARYGEVSRQHLKFQAIADVDGAAWQACDLNSANGTYINQQPLVGCQTLQTGDRIRLGRNGPEFIFEATTTPRGTVPSGNRRTGNAGTTRPPVPAPVVSQADTDALSLSQLLPIVSKGRELSSKAYLIPGVITVSFVVLLFLANGVPELFNPVLALYVSSGACYFVYLLCGKTKPWWLLVGSALMTVVLLLSPVLPLFILVFRSILPGSIPQNIESIGFMELLVRMFFGAGLMEELLKAIPIFLGVALGHRLRSPQRERWGVLEPLDGILIGVASAAGFTLIETLGQYVPDIINSVSMQGGQDLGQLVGLHLLIPRILGSIAGHMAYSGYFGYFIGLSVLKPRSRWTILAIGYLSSSLLHALWNAIGILSFFLLAVIGVLSYAFLGAAILKARELSPTRSQNFATRVSRIP
ncbi:PrsW family glutamic-type intramembrane protease [Leptolyngbya sp. CCY15150]|uniref:PrsW family glutamic-type intramembrane protease n=1 Tax=Leptolyngbya sp. CCY15150 TaxID=2767772 RepID=UPI001951267A|nr:PrsW family glutamic-type intramembrane protease [Leptolyngbya sp. CCY15150]